MNAPAALASVPSERARWATASLDSAPDTTPGELSSLEAHVDRCKRSGGIVQGLEAAADAVHAFVAPRLVTTTVIVGFVLGVASAIL